MTACRRPIRATGTGRCYWANAARPTDRRVTSGYPAVRKEGDMASRGRRYGPAGGITLGGIIVIVGIILIFIWSFWIGLIVALVGLIFFGGFARGRWY